MSITFSVNNLPIHLVNGRHFRGPWFVAGRLWLDGDGARLYDWDSEASVPLCDPEACSALRASLPPPGDYLGGALLQVFIRLGLAGPELHTAYWVHFFERNESGPDQWGALVNVRPVPPEHDAHR